MMKTGVLVLVFTLSACCAFAQDEAPTAEQQDFEKGLVLFELDNFTEAAAAFESFMLDHPLSDLTPRAHYNLALSLFNAHDYAKARNVFLTILRQAYNERDDNSIMEPYALYKHHSCRMLAAMALEEKQYDEAEKYIHMFHKTYPYQHFCGNEWSAYDMYVSVMYAKLYGGRNRIDKALEQLIPHLFTNALASNEYVLMELEDIFDNNYSCEYLRGAFAEALASITNKKRQGRKVTVIELLGITAEVEPDYFYDPAQAEQPETDRYLRTVKEHRLFKKYL